MLAICFNEYNELSDAKTNKMKHKNDHGKLFLEANNYDVYINNNNCLGHILIT